MVLVVTMISLSIIIVIELVNSIRMCQMFHRCNTLQMKALKCKHLAEFDANIGIFGLKTPLHAYVLLGEHTSMKNSIQWTKC